MMHRTKECMSRNAWMRGAVPSLLLETTSTHNPNDRRTWLTCSPPSLLCPRPPSSTSASSANTSPGKKWQNKWLHCSIFVKQSTSCWFLHCTAVRLETTTAYSLIMQEKVFARNWHAFWLPWPRFPDQSSFSRVTQLHVHADTKSTLTQNSKQHDKVTLFL